MWEHSTGLILLISSGSATQQIGWPPMLSVSTAFFSPIPRDPSQQILAVYFARHHNPNPPAHSISLLRNTNWSKWSSSIENPPLLSLFDKEVNITSDTYRSDAIKLMIQLLKE
jgi:hypothetical protein